MNCQHCQNHLVAYMHDEAPPRLSRRIARHLRECETCYAAYVRERGAAQQMTQDLAWFGQPDDAQLNRIWATVQTELDAPTPRRRAYPWRHVLAMAAMLLLCALPWALHGGNLDFPRVALPATPAFQPGGTPSGTQTVKLAALDTNTPTEDVLPPTPTSTPPMAPIPDTESLSRDR